MAKFLPKEIVDQIKLRNEAYGLAKQLNEALQNLDPIFRIEVLRVAIGDCRMKCGKPEAACDCMTCD